MQVLLLRHGQTAGNLRRAYIGSSDEPLCQEGLECAAACAKLLASEYSQIDGLYVSPLQRARQTAQICYPGVEQHVVDGLREMDFGDFEAKTYQDMDGDPRYQEWVDGMCEGACPNGEDRAGFIARTQLAFEQLLSQARLHGEEKIALVAHGGTIMALLFRYAQPAREYFDWHVGNCEGYVAQLDFSADGEPVLLDPFKLELPKDC